MTADADAYDELAERLSATASPMDPGEVHGRLCGYLCAVREPSPDVWLADVTFDIDGEEGGLKHKLVEMWESTLQQLNGDAFEFQPLLPSFDCSLNERVEALSHFSAGFIAGLSLAGQAGTKAGKGQNHLAEFVADMREMSRLALAEADVDEEGDFAYAELVEYVRAGIQLCWDELRSSQGDTNAVH